jgi:hypothetical protein
MKKFTIILLAVVVASSLLWRSDSHAASLTLYLQNAQGWYNIQTDPNGPGFWQHSGGYVYADLNYTTMVGSFSVTRRITYIGIDEGNPTITMTIIFPGENPPQNITLQGVQNTGYSEWGLLNFRGGVSAASAKYSRMVVGSALCVDNLPLSAPIKAVLTIDYPGPNIPVLNLLLLN